MYLLSSCRSFSVTFMESRRVWVGGNYFPFIFELRHTSHLSISKLVKKCTVKFLLSDSFNSAGVCNGTDSFVKVRWRVL